MFKLNEVTKTIYSEWMLTESSFVELFYLTTFYGTLILLCYFNCYFPLLQNILFRIPRVKQRRNLASPRYCQLQVHHINLRRHQKLSDPPWQEPGRIQITSVGTQTAREADPELLQTKSHLSMEVWRTEGRVPLTAQRAATTVIMVAYPLKLPDPCTTTTKDFKVKSNNAFRTQSLHLSCSLLICGQKKCEIRKWTRQECSGGGGGRDPCVQMFYRLSWNIFWPLHSWH